MTINVADFLRAEPVPLWVRNQMEADLNLIQQLRGEIAELKDRLAHQNFAREFAKELLKEIAAEKINKEKTGQ